MYNVFDEAAGNYFCVASAVWPHATTKDLEDNPDGDGSWFISKPSCQPIAKRPTFQVWGGGVFSAGNITTNVVTEKNNVLDENGTRDSFSRDWYNMTSAWADKVNWQKGQGQTTKSLFGSWGELGILAGGNVENMASGATTGYGPHTGESTGIEYDSNSVSPWLKLGEAPGQAGSGNVVGMGTPGGLRGYLDFCLRSPISIANSGCSIGGYEKETLLSSLESDKDAILKRFPSGANNGTYLRQDGVSAISGWPAGAPSTVIVYNGGDITITGNIVMPNANGLHTLQDVPKMYIYSDGSVKVNCNVTRIDAIIIAKDTFQSCNLDTSGFGDGTYTPGSASGGWNTKDLYNQLVINGTVVADKLVLNRAYGAGTGRYSMVPAELINYDSSIYLWANREAEGVSSGSITETAARELAPRY